MRAIQVVTKTISNPYQVQGFVGFDLLVNLEQNFS